MSRRSSLRIILGYLIVFKAYGETLSTYEEFIEKVQVDMREKNCDPVKTIIATDLDEVIFERLPGSDLLTFATYFNFEGTFLDAMKRLPEGVTFLPLTSRLSDEFRIKGFSHQNPIHERHMRYLKNMGVPVNHSKNLINRQIKKKGLSDNFEIDHRGLRRSSQRGFGGVPPVYREGTIMTSGLNKGDILKDFFQMIGLLDLEQDDKDFMANLCLYFIDDALINIIRLRSAMETLTLKRFLSFLYRGSEDHYIPIKIQEKVDFDIQKILKSVLAMATQTEGGPCVVF